MKYETLPKLIETILNSLDEIDAKCTTLQQKSSRWIKLSKQVHKVLLREDKAEDAISPTTYHSYLTSIRNAIKETDRKHPSLLSTIKRKGYLAKVISTLPAYENELIAISNMKATVIGEGVSRLKEQLHNDLKASDLDKAIDSVDSLLYNHPMITYMRKSKARREQRNNAENKSLEEKSRNMKKYNMPSVLKLAESLLESDSYTSLAWGLALLTGRRSVELLYQGGFEIIDINNVLFSGQAKKREGVKSESYPIPVLADSALIVKALDRLRALPEVSVYKTGSGTYQGEEVNYSDLAKRGSRHINTAINQRSNGVLNSKAKNLMGDGAEVFKNTRGIYARYCSDTVRLDAKKWEGVNEDEFLKAILGHSSTKEIKHYRQVILSHEKNKEWLKVKEPEKEKKADKPKEKAKRNTRAGKEIKEIGELIKAYPDDFVMVGGRKVKVRANNPKTKSITQWHFECLSAWAYENSKMEITQSAVINNKGNTISAGTGSVDVKVNRYTFRAWATIAGDLLEKYNARKS
jgi:integrase